MPIILQILKHPLAWKKSTGFHVALTEKFPLTVEASD